MRAFFAGTRIDAPRVLLPPLPIKTKLHAQFGAKFRGELLVGGLQGWFTRAAAPAKASD